MAVRIVTDSTADLTAQEKQDFGVSIVPLGYTFGEQSYKQGVDLTIPEYYQKLRTSKELPTTTQANPDAFAQVYAPFVAAGDEIVVITISSAISGTYQSAMLAAREFSNANIVLVDTQSAAMGAYILVHEAVRLRDLGKSAVEIGVALTALRARIAFYAIIGDLTYLVKGGRLSGIGGKIGGLLNIKPIVTIGDGLVKMADKQRGMKKAYDWLAQQVHADGVDPAYPVCLAHSDAPELPPQLREVIEADLAGCEVQTRMVGEIIGTHAGPGCVALSYITK